MPNTIIAVILQLNNFTLMTHLKSQMIMMVCQPKLRTRLPEAWNC